MSRDPRPADGQDADLAAFDLLPDPVVTVGPDGSVRHLNRLAERLLGRAREDLVGLAADRAVSLRDESGDPWWLTERPLEADPHLHVRIPERDLILQVGLGERPVTLTGARWARSDGTWLVLVLRRAERRQRLDAARSDLVATVSHELRSPLTAVKGFTKTLLAKWDRFSDAQKRHMLTTVNADADRVTRLLGELLDVSRIDAGRLRLQRRRVDVGALVAEVAGRAASGEQAPPVAVDRPASLPEVYADGDKLAQVVTNLVENAVTHGKGPVRVAVRSGDGQVGLTVSDEGGGIDRQHLRHLFTKFYRGGADRRSGTGLGLYITKGIVEAHGGRIWAESEPGAGTHFHVELPIGELPGTGGARQRQGEQAEDHG